MSDGDRCGLRRGCVRADEQTKVHFSSREKAWHALKAKTDRHPESRHRFVAYQCMFEDCQFGGGQWCIGHWNKDARHFGSAFMVFEPKTPKTPDQTVVLNGEEYILEGGVVIDDSALDRSIPLEAWEEQREMWNIARREVR